MPLIDRESRSSSTACISLGIVPLDLLLAASGPGLPTLPAHQGTVPQSELPSGGCANRLAFGQGNQDVVRAPLSSHPGINNTTSSWKSVQWVGGERSSCNLSYLLSYLIHSPLFTRDKQAEANWGYPVLQRKQELNNRVYFRSFSYVSWNVPGTSLYSKSSPAFKAMHIRLPLWGRGDTPSVSHKPLRSKQQLKKSVDVHNGKAEARIFLTKNVIFY